ncbi:hypothetical protein BD626DRAFT_569227 [Schizophyllum amplum]|uniref:Uncharacterized protein n=1 Tax=Schizophyllum amplum TaxID=97359 RepID=A0A550CEG8_9AGAR|nr:hypothetical protein BD626DRAFT_569227 [Auriculariopsis ampla]
MADSVPSSPQAWLNWANSIPLSKIPAKNDRTSTATNLILHDVFTDLGALKTDEADFVFAYTDILAFSPGTRVSLSLPEMASINLYTRVITSEQPVTLELVPSSDEDAQVVLWATYLDQPVTVCLAGQTGAHALDLGVASGNIGVSIICSNGDLTVTYLKKYDVQDLRADGNLAKLLATQLRIASTLFWIQPSIALCITGHVVRVTCLSYDCALLNVQASALQQQIRASQLAGPGVSYAPVLKLEYYKHTMSTVLDAGSAFQQQYDRFTDNEASVDDQLKAWDSMLKQARNTVTMQQQLAGDAKSKWDAAQDMLRTARNDMRRHQLTLQEKAMDFRLGIEAWKRDQAIKAVANILTAVVTFAIAIGAMCVGDPAPAAAAPAEAAVAIKAVAGAAEAASQVTKVITKNTLETIDKVVQALSKLLETTVSNVTAIIDATGTAGGTLRPFPASERNEDLQALAGVAAWDKWTLDIEDQMAFAISEKINGASAYLLELRKHAIDGKLTTQASAQAVKAGQEFVQLRLALHLAQTDLDRLQRLRDEFTDEKAQLSAARLLFYDRLDAMRTSTLIELRNLVWAFKFYTLTDSKVSLNPLLRMEEYKVDMATLVQEVEKWEEGFASDKSPVHFKRDINDPTFHGIGPGVVASLKKDYMATFALAPSPAVKVLPFPSGPFTGGSCFRVFGMRVYLTGLVPKPQALSADNTALIWVTVRTSGVYTDIRRDDTVLGFTSMLQERQFKYRVDAQGQAIQGGIEVDSIIQMGQHMDPPPFTQWSIRVNHPELLDLQEMKSIELEWVGRAYM